MIHPRFVKNFAFHPPWGDCREIGLLRASDPQERPPPPPEAHESSLRTPDSYPDETAKRQKNAKKRAKKAEKERAQEEQIVVLSNLTSKRKRPKENQKVAPSTNMIQVQRK